MSSNVKVTLSADDQATEIVRRLSVAVKQLAAENKKNSQNLDDSGRAANNAASGFNKMAAGISSIAAAIGAFKVLAFVRDTIDAADQLGKLAQKTGASTEALSALAVAASTADLSQEELGQGLKFLARSVTELQAGSQDIAAAFSALGLSASQLKGLSLDQIFVKIADAQAKFGDGAGKTAALMKIFGRSGEELIPLLNDLANGGFETARAKAQSLGLVLGRDATQAAQNFNDSLTDLKNSARGAIDRLLPIAMALTDMAKAVTAFVAAHPDFAAFGAGATIAAAGATLVAAGLGAAAVAAFALDVALAPVIIAIGILAAAGGGIALLVKQFQDAKKEAEGLGDATKKATANAASNLPQVVLTDPAQVKALREARLQATQQGAKDELAIVQSTIKQREALEQAAFDTGVTSLRQFYAQRLAATQQGTAAQIAELQKEKTALINSPLSENTDAARVQRATQIATIEEQIKRAKIDGETQVIQLTQQQVAAVKSLRDELEGFASQMASASGREVQVQQIAIEQGARRLEEALRKVGGLTDDEIARQRNAFTQLLTDRAAFEENQRQGQRALTDLGLQRQSIELKAQQGLISQHDATQQIAALEKSRLPTLQAIADRMDFFAASVKDEGLQQAAKEFRAQFEGIGTVIRESDLLIANLGDSIRSAVKGSISDFLTTGIDSVIAKDTSTVDGLTERLSLAKQELTALLKGPQNDEVTQRVHELRQQIQDLNVEVDSAKKQLPTIGDAFKSSLLSGVQAIQRAIADILAAKIVEKLGDFFGGGTQTVAAAATASAAAALGTAGALVTAGATTLAGASVGLDASSVGLSTSGGILLTAAAALTAAASALAAAGVFGALGGFASGGVVRGPGSSTSDSIPARLSAGEFVIRASVVKRLGIPFFEALNGARMPMMKRPFVSGMPAFASGGFVDGGGGGAAHVSGEIGLHVSADEGLIIRQLGSRGGLRALRQVISDNPAMFRAALQL